MRGRHRRGPDVHESDPLETHMNAADDPWGYCLQIPPDPRGAAVARTTLRAVLAEHDLTVLADVAVLLASELVGNALAYSDGAVSMRLGWWGPRLRLGVRDNCPTPPTCRDPAQDSEGGRGLYLVNHLATKWGYHLIGEEPFGIAGKIVWCDVTEAAAVRLDQPVATDS